MSQPAKFPDLVLSERLRIDLFTVSDAGFIIALLNSKGWLEGIGDRNVRTSDEAVAFIEKINRLENFRYWAVRLKTGAAIGVISCIKRDYLDRFDMGFAFLPEYNGKGYALEASGEVIRELKKQTRFQRLVAFALPENLNSLRLLKRLGFVYESQFRNDDSLVHLYASDGAVSG